jgi:N-acetyltransferase
MSAAAPWPDAVTLEGRHAILRPTTVEDAPALAEAAADGELWKLWYTFVPRPEEFADVIAERLRKRAEASEWLMFTVLEPGSGRVLGSTTYMHINAALPRVEIGSTWYRSSVQRTAVNTECKLMLLRHAFEALDCVAVEFRTHFLNVASRRAIERLGARLDGIMRHDSRMRDGSLRDTAVYTILPHEWPAVRANLEFRLSQ